MFKYRDFRDFNVHIIPNPIPLPLSNHTLYQIAKTYDTHKNCTHKPYTIVFLRSRFCEMWSVPWIRSQMYYNIISIHYKNVLLKVKLYATENWIIFSSKHAFFILPNWKLLGPISSEAARILLPLLLCCCFSLVSCWFFMSSFSLSAVLLLSYYCCYIPVWR